jgi:hypothetical protein
MSFLAVHAKAVTFFVLGVFVTAVAVATTHAASAQFGRPQAVSSIRWSFQRAEVPGRGQGVIAAKCLPTERVISGGYKLVNVNDGSNVNVLQSYPDNFENAYVVVISNGFTTPIVAYSDVGCETK